MALRRTVGCFTESGFLKRIRRRVPLEGGTTPEPRGLRRLPFLSRDSVDHGEVMWDAQDVPGCLVGGDRTHADTSRGCRQALLGGRDRRQDSPLAGEGSFVGLPPVEVAHEDAGSDTNGRSQRGSNEGAEPLEVRLVRVPVGRPDLRLTPRPATGPVQQILGRVESTRSASAQLTPPQQSCAASTELGACPVKVGLC